MKDLGTDIPGVIICIYIFLIIFYHTFEKEKEDANGYFFNYFLLCQFALLLKFLML